MGSLNVEDSLTIGSGFALTPSGMTVDVETHTGTLFELQSRNTDFNGSLLELHTKDSRSSMIKAVNDGVTTFELSSSGHLRMNSVRLISGGVNIESGGLQVGAGGIAVKGGLTIATGTLQMPNAAIDLAQININSPTDNIAKPLLHANIPNARYATNAIDISIDATTGNDDVHNDKFHWLQFSKHSKTGSSHNTTVFQVSADGTVTTKGSVDISGGDGLTVHGLSKLLGSVHISKQTIYPTPSSDNNSGRVKAMIPATASYVVISPFETNQKNVEIDFEPFGNAQGRVVIITNQLNSITLGEIQIPADSTILLVYNGAKWVDIEALRAPIHVLKNIRSLQADSDLDIGPHQFTAQRLKSTQLKKNSIVIAGNDGLLMDNDKLLYEKGVLTTPSLKFDKLVSNIDAKGNEIKNVVLNTPKINDAIITASSIVMPSQSAGLAFFDSKGTLSSSTGISVDADGKLKISSLHSDMDMNSRTIKNAVLQRATLQNAESISVDQISVTSLGSNREAILTTNEKGTLVKSNAIVVDVDTNSVQIDKLKVNTLAGPLNGNNEVLSNIQIHGGSIHNTRSIATKELIVENLKLTTANNQAAPARIVYVNSQGKLQTASESLSDDNSSSGNNNNAMHISSISTDHITFSNPTTTTTDIDFKNRKLSHLKLDALTVDYGKPELFETKSLTISELKSRSTNQIQFLSTNNDGKVEVVKDISMDSATKTLKFESGTIDTKTIITDTLQLDTVRGSILGTDEHGDVQGVDDIVVATVTATEKMIVPTGSELIIEGVVNSILVTNEKGKVTTLDSAEGQKISLETASIKSKSIASSDVTADKITITDGITVNTLKSTTKNRQHLLFTDKTGRIEVSEKVTVEINDDTSILHINQISPLTSSDTLHIAKASLQHVNISQAMIQDCSSISTNSLIVEQTSEFRSDVLIDGTVTVHGTVIGSGPYVDSSDRRFKHNIQPITNALDLVTMFNAVNYEFKTNEYPTRNFPKTKQVGWIADEMHKIIPELVSTDNDGYQSIAYSHASVYVAQAIKELQTKYDEQIVELKNEIHDLKQLVNMLLVASSTSLPGSKPLLLNEVNSKLRANHEKE